MPQGIRQDARDQGGNGAEGQGTGLRLGADAFGQVVPEGHDLARPFHQGPPLGIEQRRAVIAVEEHASEIGLQALHLQADGRLGAAESIGRLGVTAQVGHRDERPQKIGGKVCREHIYFRCLFVYYKY